MQERLQAKVLAGPHRRKLPKGYRTILKPILGDLDHQYGLETKTA